MKIVDDDDGDDDNDGLIVTISFSLIQDSIFI